MEFDPDRPFLDNSAISLDLSQFCRPAEQACQTVSNDHFRVGPQPGIWMGQDLPGPLDIEPLTSAQVVEASNGSVAHNSTGAGGLEGKWRTTDTRSLGVDFGWGSPEDKAVTVVGDVGDAWLGDALLEVAIGKRNQLEEVKMDPRIEEAVIDRMSGVEALAQGRKTSMAAVSFKVVSLPRTFSKSPSKRTYAGFWSIAFLLSWL